MTALVMIGQILLGLSIIVVLHEYGHYLAARSFGMKVEKFFLFFDAGGKKLFSFTKGDTEYGIGWLPLGGYVKIAGMIDESMDTEQLKQEPQPWEFRAKPAWQRLIVMVAGVVVNLILGAIIFSLVTLYYGESYIPVDKMEHGIVANDLGQEIGLKTGDKIKKVNGEEIQRFSDLYSTDFIFQENSTLTIVRNGKDTTIRMPDGFANKIAGAGKEGFASPRFKFYVDKVRKSSPAEKAGLKADDRIIAVDGKETVFFDQFKNVLEDYKGEEVAMKILRDGDTLNKTVAVKDNGTIGFYAGNELPQATQYYGLAGAFKRGTERGYGAIEQTVIGLGKVFGGEVDAQKSVQGPISIAKNFYGGTWDWNRFWYITGLLSLIIGFMNILPIPALDGGHALFLIFEIIRGKPVPDKAYQVIQTIGVVLLLSLMVFVIFNDIWQNFIK